MKRFTVSRFTFSPAVAAILIVSFVVAYISIAWPELIRITFSYSIVTITFLLILQSLFTIYTMVFTWNDPETYREHSSPQRFSDPFHSISAIVAARNESRVIGDTIQALNRIAYPDDLKEIIVVLRHDDMATVLSAQKVVETLGNPRIKLVVSREDLQNKPMSLNVGLKHATGDIVVVFDAEDEPHTDIYNAVNTTFRAKHVDVVQSGVQLMDYRSSWYSTLNVLEYYFWFKSALHFFAKIGAVPLGGNTVFFRRTILEQVGGWNEGLLTEDADIGIRLSSMGAKIAIMYDERHATQEETPHNLKGFIKQRTRWNQGFLQILFLGTWMKVPTLSQKLLLGYLLSTPLLQALWLLYLPFSLALMTLIKLPIGITLFSFIPLYLLLFQYVLYTVGLYLFTKDYKKTFPVWMPIKLLCTLYPYQMILGWSSLHATRRLIKKDIAWEKTEHTNAHRVPVQLATVEV